MKTGTKKIGAPLPRALGLKGGMFFRQLIESPEFVQFAMILKQLTRLSMALNTPDVATTLVGVPGDKGNLLCKIIRGTAEGARRCEACDRRQHARAGSARKAKLYSCHAGFYDMAIPIMIQGEHVATVSSGQVLSERPSDAGFARLRRRLRWLGMQDRQLRQAYDKAPWMPKQNLTHVMRLLEVFSRQMCDSAWRIRELEASLERPEICKARTLVEERFMDPQLQLSDAATCAGMSIAHFSHMFHKETGVTFTRYVQSRRIEEAKHRLAETDNSITDICFSCGFNSLTHFNRVFRRSEQRSPRQYRSVRPGRTHAP